MCVCVFKDIKVFFCDEDGHPAPYDRYSLFKGLMLGYSRGLQQGFDQATYVSDRHFVEDSLSTCRTTSWISQWSYKEDLLHFGRFLAVHMPCLHFIDSVPWLLEPACGLDGSVEQSPRSLSKQGKKPIHSTNPNKLVCNSLNFPGCRVLAECYSLQVLSVFVTLTMAKGLSDQMTLESGS